MACVFTRWVGGARAFFARLPRAAAAAAAGQARYTDGYARHLGGRDGVLSRHGARSTLAAECFGESLLGEEHFERAIIAEVTRRRAPHRQRALGHSPLRQAEQAGGRRADDGGATPHGFIVVIDRGSRFDVLRWRVPVWRPERDGPQCDL